MANGKELEGVVVNKRKTVGYWSVRTAVSFVGAFVGLATMGLGGDMESYGNAVCLIGLALLCTSSANIVFSGLEAIAGENEQSHTEKGKQCRVNTDQPLPQR